MRLQGRILICLLMLFSLTTGRGGARATADEAVSRYLAQLRRRKLFRLAEGICDRQLARDDITDTQRSQWTLELSRTLAEHAPYASGKEAAQLWRQATRVIGDFLQRHPAAPRNNWLRLQRATVLVIRGEFLRWEAQLMPCDPAVRSNALQMLDRADEQLQQLLQQLPSAGNASSGSATGKNAAPAAGTERTTGADRPLLRRHLNYQRALVLLNKAELSPAGSPQRNELLQQADRLLRPLSEGPAEAVITQNSRFLRAVVSRLAGRHREAVDRLKVLQKQRPSLQVQQHIRAELVRILLDGGHLKEADRLLQAFEKSQAVLLGELIFLRVKASLALWQNSLQAGDQPQAEQWWKEAQRALGQAEHFTGGYWTYRCRLLLDFAREKQRYGPELAVAVRTAQAQFRHGNLADSLAAYRRAVRLAEESGRKKFAAELRFLSASLLLQGGRLEEAAAEFGRLADAVPPSSRSAQADLMRAYCLGRLYEKRRTRDRRQKYTEALKTHRKKFPASPTAHEAAWMLAVLSDYRRQTAEALQLYLSIPPEHPRAAAAQSAAARCYEEILQRLRAANAGERTSWETHALSHLERYLKSYPPQASTWNRFQADVAFRTARIHLQRTPPGYRAAEPLLRQVTEAARHALSAQQKGKPSAEERRWWQETLRSARQGQIVALAGTGRFAEAETLLKTLSQSGPAEVLAVLDGLMKIGADKERLRRQLGTLQLQAALKLDKQRSRLKPSERQWLDRCLAQAYASTGNVERAVRLYQKLLKDSPSNQEFLRSLAELLSRSSARDTLLQARTCWRKLESLQSPGSPEWLQARYQVARVTFRLAEYRECRKLLDVTGLLYPQLGGEPLRSRFRQLRSDVQQKLGEEKN